MSPLRQWNGQQALLFRRLCGLYRVPLTPDLIGRLATRYAEKHAAERRRALAPADTGSR